MAQLLLQKGLTALMTAATISSAASAQTIQMKLDFARLLLEHNADLTWSNTVSPAFHRLPSRFWSSMQDGKTALGCAASCPKMVEILQVFNMPHHSWCLHAWPVCRGRSAPRLLAHAPPDDLFVWVLVCGGSNQLGDLGAIKTG